MLGLQFMSFLGLGVKEFGLAGILWWTSHIWSLSGVITVHVDSITGTDEIKSYLVDRLAFVQSDLDSTLTGANSLKVVLSDLGRYYMLHISNTFE